MMGTNETEGSLMLYEITYNETLPNGMVAAITRYSVAVSPEDAVMDVMGRFCRIDRKQQDFEAKKVDRFDGETGRLRRWTGIWFNGSRHECSVDGRCREEAECYLLAWIDGSCSYSYILSAGMPVG